MQPAAASSMTMRASSTREAMCSLRNAWRRWWATVWVLMYMRAATWLLFSPSATSLETACSVSVRLSQPATGLVAGVVQWRRRMPSSRSRRRMRAWSRSAPAWRYPSRAAFRCLMAWSLAVPVRRMARSSAAEALAHGSGCCAAASAEKARVAGGETLAMRRGRGQGREPRVGVGEGHGGAGDLAGQGLVAGRERGAHQPGRKGRFAGQQPLPCRETGSGLADVTDGGGRAVARLSDLGLDQRGLGARVQAGEMRYRGGEAGDVLCRGRDVAAAQRDHGQNAVRGRGVPVSS